MHCNHVWWLTYPPSATQVLLLASSNRFTKPAVGVLRVVVGVNNWISAGRWSVEGDGNGCCTCCGGTSGWSAKYNWLLFTHLREKRRQLLEQHSALVWHCKGRKTVSTPRGFTSFTMHLLFHHPWHTLYQRVSRRTGSLNLRRTKWQSTLEDSNLHLRFVYSARICKRVINNFSNNILHSIDTEKERNWL